MDTQALFAAGTYTTLDIYEKCRAREILITIEKLLDIIATRLTDDESLVISIVNRKLWSNTTFSVDNGIRLGAEPHRSAIKYESSPVKYNLIISLGFLFSCNNYRKYEVYQDTSLCMIPRRAGLGYLNVHDSPDLRGVIYGMFVELLKIIAKLLLTNTVSTKRDIFYQHPNLFPSQRHVDEYVDDIACLLTTPRWNLNVIATSKGCIAGDLQYTEEDGNFIDCSQSNTGVLIPGFVQKLQDLQSGAKFVLVVEKDATFQKLLDDNFCETMHPCIIITGRGFPDVNTRLMVRLLHDVLQIPIFALVDADPHGMEIFLVYKYGSKSLAFENHALVVPSMKLLGILPSEIQRFAIPEEKTIPYSSADASKAADLLTRPYMPVLPDIRTEVEISLSLQRKAEIQCLTHFSDGFLSNVYLPNKIAYQL